jgi:hypothetical protein
VLKIKKHSSVGSSISQLFLRLDFLENNRSAGTLHLGSHSSTFLWNAAGMPEWMPTAQNEKVVTWQES